MNKQKNGFAGDDIGLHHNEQAQGHGHLHDRIDSLQESEATLK